MTPVSSGLRTVWRPAFDLHLSRTLSPLRRGAGDPCHHREQSGAIWRSSLFPAGAVTYRVAQAGSREIECQVWGPGAEEFLEQLPRMFGRDDNPESFIPRHRMLSEAVHRFPGLRMIRTDRVLEALVPAILEQKVTGKQAFSAWRTLVMAHGTVAPGPVPVPLWTPPSLPSWRGVASWEWHRAGVEPAQSAAIARALRIVESLERVGKRSSVGELGPVKRALSEVPGIGVWTVAEIAQRAWGDPDALSVGDYHLAGFVGWSLLGRAIDDEQMVRLLSPWDGHRHRLVRLLALHPGAGKPRFGPRITIQDHRRL